MSVNVLIWPSMQPENDPSSISSYKQKKLSPQNWPLNRGSWNIKFLPYAFLKLENWVFFRLEIFQIIWVWKISVILQHEAEDCISSNTKKHRKNTIDNSCPKFVDILCSYRCKESKPPLSTNTINRLSQIEFSTDRFILVKIVELTHSTLTPESQNFTNFHFQKLI